MKHSKTLITLAMAGLFFVACSGNQKEKMNADSSGTGTDGTAVDSTMKTDTSVKPADSTRSFRNDRGTDSVSAGKSVPAKP